MTSVDPGEFTKLCFPAPEATLKTADSFFFRISYSSKSVFQKGKLMIVNSSTIYKLMILYMLNKLDSQLTNSQLSSFFIEKNYTDYFTIQQILSDLETLKFVDKAIIRNTSYYSVTPEGYETLTLFKKQIPAGAMDDINSFLEENKCKLKNEVGTQSDYYKHTNGDYICVCRIMEGKSLLYEVQISVPSEEDAITVCNNWRGCSEDIYAYIMHNLLQ